MLLVCQVPVKNPPCSNTRLLEGLTSFWRHTHTHDWFCPNADAGSGTRWAHDSRPEGRICTKAAPPSAPLPGSGWWWRALTLKQYSWQQMLRCSMMILGQSRISRLQ